MGVHEITVSRSQDTTGIHKWLPRRFQRSRSSQIPSRSQIKPSGCAICRTVFKSVFIRKCRVARGCSATTAQKYALQSIMDVTFSKLSVTLPS